MSAQIRISVERGGVVISTNVNQSVDNVRKGDVIYCESVDVHTTYAWTLVFTPDSPNGTVSSSGLINPPGSSANNCKFIIDNEGAYLIRLVVDAGLATESTQFLRIRKVTRFGDLKLVAAGERKDSVGAIPYDIDVVGWADNQNQNLQKLLAYVRRLSTSGRVLYVDANRGRKAYDSTQNANDFTNTLEMPGADLAALTTSGVVTDAEGFADFSDISSAISYASACTSRGETTLSTDSPYVILVQNGLYIEDVNLHPNIHIVSADNFFTNSDTYAKGVVIRSTNATGGHTFVGTNNNDSVICVGVEFENTDGASTNPTFKVQKGIAYFIGCTISHKSGTGGSALSVIPINPTSTDECQAYLINSYVQNTVTNATDYAIKCGSDCAYLVLKNSTIVGQNGIQCNADFGGGLKEEVHLHLYRSTVMANNVGGYAILSNASDLKIEHSYVVGSDATKVLVIGENLPKVGDVIAKLSFSEFYNAQITFDTRQIAGTKMLKASSCIYSGYVFPDAPPTFNAETQAKSLKYENNYADPFNSGALAVPVPNQLGAEDVQDAIDDLAFLSAILGAFGVFNSLDVAYDGIISVNPPTLGSGSGRKISADQGAVVIQSATSPYTTTPISGTETTPLASADKNGYLQIEGNLEVGKIDSAEMELISNYGTIGSMLSMGSVTWNSEIASVASGVDHRSLPSAIIQGNSDKDGLLHNYNVRLQTKSTNNISNGSVGWVILQGGDSLEKGADAPHAGDVYIQGGSYLESTFESIGADCPAGNVHLIPGTSTGIGADKPYGYVKLINPTASTSATLLASAAPSNPTTCAGEISWATPMGVVTATITIGMTIADVINAINNATVGAGLIFAQQSSGFISLSCVSKGELSDIVYVGDSDSGNINADLGDFQISSGATFVAGTDPQYVNIHSSAMHEITIGEGGATGPMIYNSATGKLTVPGLIDPTGMIFTQTNLNNVPTNAVEGAIFVSDGTDGLVVNKLYYKPASNGTPILLSGGGSGGGLVAWTEDTSGNLYPNTANVQDLGSQTNAVENLYLKDDTGLIFTDGTTNATVTVSNISGTPTLQFNGIDLVNQTSLTADLSTKIGLSDLSVSTNAASGGGALSYNDANGQFTFTPADVSGSFSFTIHENGSSNTPTTINSGDQITFTDVAGETNVVVSGQNVTVGLSTIGGVAGTYTSADITVDDKGRITAASNGSGGGGLSGSGNSQELGVFDGSGAINGVSTLTYNSAAYSLFVDSSAVAFGSFTHYSNSSAGTENWIVGRSQDGSLLLRTQSTYNATFNESDYDLGWSIDSSGHLLPSIPSGSTPPTLDIGNNTNRVRSIYVDATQSVHFIYNDGGTIRDYELDVDVANPTTPVLRFNGSPVGGGGSGSQYEIATFGSGGLANGDPQFTFDDGSDSGTGHDRKLMIDSDNADKHTYLHFSNSGDGTFNWVMGREQGGNFTIATQSTYAAQTAGTVLTGSYDLGWNFETSGDLVPIGSSRNIGRTGLMVNRVYADEVGGSNTLDFYVYHGGSEKHLMQGQQGGLYPQETTGFYSAYSLGASTNRWNEIWCDSLYANSSSIHFRHDDGSGNTGNGGNEYDFALGVDTTDLTKPKLTFNGATIGGDYAVVSQHSVATKYGSATNPLIYKVTVGTKTQNHPYDGVAGSSSNAYFIDGIESPAIRFSGADSGEGSYYYRFDQSHNSNNGHPLRFYLTADKTTAYTTGVTVVGAPGTAGAYTQIEVSGDTPNILYYQCSAHPLMGNHATIISNTFNDEGVVTTVSQLRSTIQQNDTKVYIDDDNSGASDDGRVYIQNNGVDTWYFDKAGSLYNMLTAGDQHIGRLDIPLASVRTKSVAAHYDFNTSTNGSIRFETVNLASPDPSQNAFFTLEMNQTSKRLEFRGNQLAYNSEITASGISYTDLSVTTNAVSGSGALSYDNTTGTFTYTPPDLSGTADKIQEGDTKVEVADTGTNGAIIFSTEGTEKWRIRTTGNLVPQGTTGVIDIGQSDKRINDIYTNTLKVRDAGGNYVQLASSLTGAGVGRLNVSTNIVAYTSDTLNSFGGSNFFDTDLIPTANTFDIGGTTDNQVNEFHTRNIIFYDGSNNEQGRFKPASQGTAIQVQGSLRIEDTVKFNIQTAYGNYSTDPTDDGDMYLASLDETDKTRQRMVYNAPNLMWEGASDDTRTQQNSNSHIPMFAVGTERVMTLRVRDAYLKGSLVTNNDLLDGSNGDRMVIYDPNGTVDGDMDTNGFFTSNTINPLMRRVSLDTSYEQDRYVDFVFHQHLDDNVRGFGTKSYDTNGTKTPIVSFLANFKGVEHSPSVTGGGEIGIRVGVYASYYNGSSWSNTGNASTIHSLSDVVFTPAGNFNEQEHYIELTLDEPVRISELKARFGEVYVVVRAYFRGNSGTSGNFIAISDLRLNLFSS